MAKGVDWKPMSTASLKGPEKTAYDAYIKANDSAKVKAQELREALVHSYETKHPNGVNGETCAFNVINGRVMFAKVPMTKPQKQKEQEGEDPFAA